MPNITQNAMDTNGPIAARGTTTSKPARLNTDPATSSKVVPKPNLFLLRMAWYATRATMKIAGAARYGVATRTKAAAVNRSSNVSIKIP